MAKLKKIRGLRRRGRPRLVSFVLLLMLGVVGLTLLNEAPTASYANANCGGQSLAGRWINTAPIEGPDVMAATIVMPCAPATAGATDPARKTELSLTVRCLHVLSCDWQPVAASQTAGTSPGTRLKAFYDQQNFERTVAIEPVDPTHVRLTMSSRFKGLGVGTVDTVYLLERAKG